MIFFLEISSLSFDLKDDGEGVKYAHVNVFENQSQPSPPTKTNRHLKRLFLMICSGEHQMHTDLFWRSITLKLRRTYVVLVVQWCMTLTDMGLTECMGLTEKIATTDHFM